MSSSCGSTKVSDVLEILSVRTISDDNYWSIPTPASTNSWYYEREKQIFTDAVHYCMVLLRQSDRLTNHKSDIISLEATLTGQAMFEKIINVKVQTDVESHNGLFVSVDNALSHANKEIPHFQDNNQIEIKEECMDVLNELEGNLGTTSMESTRGEEELMYVDKTIRNVVREREKIDDEKSSECSRVLRSKNSTQCVGLKNNSVDENKLPPSPLSLTESDSQMPIIRNKLGSGLSKPKNYVPLEVKKKVVALAQQHPEWPLKMLREHGSEYLGCFSQLWQWERHVARGGTLKDKYNTINHRTYEKFIEAQSSSKTVTVAMLRQWAIQVSREIHGAKLQFRATKGWVYNFRKLYDIQVTSQGHLTTNHKNTVAIPRKLMRRDRRSSAT